MSAKKYHVTLSEEQRHELEVIARSNKRSLRERNRAKILLLADTNREQGASTDDAIAAQIGVCSLTVYQARQRFVSGEVKSAVFRQEQIHRKARKLDGDAEAFLVATVCSAPPAGSKRWSLHLLADKVVQAGYSDGISHETIRQTLKKMNLNPGERNAGAFRPRKRRLVCAMEDVLDVYRRPLDPKRPQVCLDEGCKQLLAHSRPSLPMQPTTPDQSGHAVREDYEYVREGTCSFFMMFAPLLSWRHVAVTERRTAKDFAGGIQDLVDVQFPDADRIVLVMDNLNTHTPASL